MLLTGGGRAQKAVWPDEVGSVHKQKGEHRPGFAAAFYVSWEWKRCREGYLKSVGGLCQRCAAQGRIAPATEVHHKKRLTPENIRDPRVALGWDNLEALCQDCHKKEHRPEIRWRCDAAGHVAL